MERENHFLVVLKIGNYEKERAIAVFCRLCGDRHYIIKVVKKMDYTSVFIVINYFCLGNTQRIIYLAHGICLEMKENYVVPLIR